MADQDTINLSELLKGSSVMGAKKPPKLPADKYPGVIKRFETGKTKGENKTPYVRYHVGLMDWPANYDGRPPEGHEDTDITKKTVSVDYYLTPQALYRLGDMCRALGISGEGKSDEEVIAEPVGAQVLVTVSESRNPNSGELNNRGEKIEALA